MKYIFYLLTLLFCFINISYAYSENPFIDYKSKYIDLSLHELEKKLIKDAEDNKLDDHTIFEAGLIASGIFDEDRTKKLKALFDKYLIDISNIKGFDKLSDVEKGKAILKYIHSKVLTKYGYYKTTLKDVFNNGMFNCLSSAVLFNAICDQFGLKTGGSTGKIHAVSILYTDKQEYLIETTNANGFKKLTSYMKRNKNIYSNINLIATLWSNKGAFIHMEGKDIECIQLTYKAIRMEPTNVEGLQNFKAGYTHYAVKLSKQGQYLKAIELMKEILPYFPKDKIFRKNILSFTVKRINSLLKKNDFETATKFVEKAREEYPDVKDFDKLRQNIFVYKAQDYMKKDEFQKAIDTYEAGLNMFPNTRIFSNNIVYVYQQWSLIFMKKKEWRKALSITELAHKRFPKNRTIINNIKYLKQKIERGN